MPKKTMKKAAPRRSTNPGYDLSQEPVSMSLSEIPYAIKMAKLRRINERTRADVEVLKEEIAEKDVTISKLRKVVAHRNTTVDTLAFQVKEHRDRKNELDERHYQDQERVRILERENGELESRISRLLVRVIVVSKSDEMAELVGALVRIREMIGPMPAGSDFSTEHGQASLEKGKLRGVLGLVAAALGRSGATEQVLSKKELEEAKEKGTSRQYPTSTSFAP